MTAATRSLMPLVIALMMVSGCGGNGTGTGDVPGDTTPPAAPSGLTALTTSATKIHLTWNDMSSNERAFRVERASSAAGPWTMRAEPAANTSQYDDAGLNPSTTYWYRVCATNATGESPYTAPVFATTPNSSDTQAPSVPTELAATAVSSSQINLSWNASTDNVGVTGYRIYRGGSLLKSVTTASSSDTGLTATTQYCYTVSAYDGGGNASAQSTQACATTSGAQVCTPSASRCVAGDMAAIETCNVSGTAWTRSTCSGYSACSNSSCHTVCELASTPAYPSVCIYPNRDGVNNGTWLTWTDARLATPTYSNGSAQESSSAAPVYSTGQPWPWAWNISTYGAVHADFKLNQFSPGRTVVLSFRAKRSLVISQYSDRFSAAVFNGNTMIDSGAWGNVPSTFQTNWVTSNVSTMNYSGGWNYFYFGITGDGFGDPVDLMDVNWVMLHVQ